MRLRSSLAAAAVFALASLGGCGTLQSGDTAARVDDAVLTQDQLAKIVQNASVGAGTPATSVGTIDTNIARDMITIWIVDQAVSAEAEQRGLDVASFEGDRSSPDDLRAHASTTYQSLLEAATATPPTDEQLQAAYDHLVCFNVAQVSTEDDAATVVAELDGGSPFADVVAAQEIEVSGFLGCYPAESAADIIANTYQDPTFLNYSDDFASVAPGKTVGPVPTQTGIWVMQRPTIDELPDDQILTVVQSALLPQLLADRDVEIASMYGAFSLTDGVVPLGASAFTQFGG